MIRDSIDFVGQSGTQARPYVRSLMDLDLHGSLESTTLPSSHHDAQLPTHTMFEAGTLVCFASLTGELCTLARAHDGTWALHLLATSSPDGPATTGNRCYSINNTHCPQATAAAPQPFPHPASL